MAGLRVKAGLVVLPLFAAAALAADQCPARASCPAAPADAADTALLQLERARPAHRSEPLSPEPDFCCSAGPSANACSACELRAEATSTCSSSRAVCEGICRSRWCGAGGSPDEYTDNATATTTGEPSVAVSVIWSDEFDSGFLDTSKWSFDIGDGGWGNQELQYYTDRAVNARVEGGSLKIVGRCEQYYGDYYTSAKMKSKVAWGPGIRVEVRAKLPKGRGSWPAIWMLPRDSVYGGWPKSGEIDIMEAVGCTADTVYGTVHTDAYNHLKGTQKSSNVKTDVASFHVYRLDWQPTYIQWFVDNTPYFVFGKESSDYAKWPFSQAFYLILNIAIGGSWGGSCLAAWPSCSNSGELQYEQVMEIDYVRVSSLA